MDTKIVTIDLDTRSYDIYIGSGLIFRLHDFIPEDLEGKRVFIVTDENVKNYAEQVQANLKENGATDALTHILPAGEKTKSFENTQNVTTWMLENGLNRDSMVVAVGGGVIGDLTGFCASIAMRGVPFVQVPTTLLSQVDSSVGGKTGINTTQGKNLIGSFYQPGAVIADIDSLKTLPKRELLAGYAEVAKYGLIRDSGFFNWLEENGADVCALDEDAVSHAIEVSCKAKAALVETDEKEHGARALLNLGHTFGHALEAEANYDGTLLHGEAISIGMVMAFDLSSRLGLCSADDLERVENHFASIGLPTKAAEIEGLNTSIDRLMSAMRHDKKIKDGKMVFVVVSAIGDAFLKNDVPENIVRDVLRESLGGDKIGTGDGAANFNAKSNTTTTLKKSMKERWKSAFSSQS